MARCCYQRHCDGYIEMSEEDATLFWEGSLNPDPTPQSESRDPTPYLEMSTREKGVSPGTVIPTVPETTHSIHVIEYSTSHTAPSDMNQDS